MKNEIRIIPLGGVEEIGKNCTVVEYKNDLVVIDAGFKFTTPDMPGVDYVIPDFAYIEKKAKNLRAVILTHGHLDHIGGLKYLIEITRPPVIAGSDLTLGLVKGMLPGKVRGSLRYKEISNGDIFNVGEMTFQFIRVTHSIPGSFGVALRTPEGNVFFTGDYKFDATPVDGKPMDIGLLEALKKEKVTVLLSDTTNADEAGLTGSESIVGQNIIKIFEEASGRIIFATFSTNIHRIQQVIDISKRFGRKVIFDGRSLVESVGIAKKLGYINIPKGVEEDISNIANLPKKEITLITTGTQGEPMSGLVRISNGEHGSVRITRGDTVIVSADPIPGNERVVSDTVNKLFKLGAFVYYRDVDGIHVSGHCSQEDIRFMIDLLRPEYFVPIHGEFKHMVYAKKIAEEEGIHAGNVILLENGSGISISGGKVRKLPRVQAGDVIVEGNLRIPVKANGEVVHIQERKQMASRGMLICVAILNKKNELTRPVYLEQRGFVLPRGSEGEVIKKAKEKVVETIRKNAKIKTSEEILPKIEQTLKDVFKSIAQKSPKIFAVILKEKK